MPVTFCKTWIELALKKILHFLTLNDFNARHKIQDISYDKLYLLKIFSKSSAFSKNWRPYLNILLVNYVHKLHLINLCPLCISVSLPWREGGKYFTGWIEHHSWLLFPICLSCSKTLPKKCLHKCRFIPELHKLEITLTIFMKYGNSASVHILWKKRTNLFAVCSWCNIFSLVIVRKYWVSYFLSQFLVMEKLEKSHGIYYVKFCGHPVVHEGSTFSG